MALDHWIDLPLELHALVFAECQGPEDPCCGRCKFSVHGCGKKPPRPTYKVDVLAKSE